MLIKPIKHTAKSLDVSVTKLRRLYDRLSTGDEQSPQDLAEMQKIYKRLAGKTNSRLRSIRKKGLTEDSNAYRRVENFIETMSDDFNPSIIFSQSKSKLNDVDWMYEGILEMRTFLTSKTSTVSGTKERIQNVKSSFEYILYGQDGVEKGMHMSDEKLRAIYDIFSGNFMHDLKQFIESNTAVSLVNDAIDNGKTKTEIRTELERYVSNQISYNELNYNLGRKRIKL